MLGQQRLGPKKIEANRTSQKKKKKEREKRRFAFFGFCTCGTARERATDTNWGTKGAVWTEAISLTSPALWTTCQRRHWSDCILSHLCTNPLKGLADLPISLYWGSNGKRHALCWGEFIKFIGLTCYSSAKSLLIWKNVSQPYEIAQWPPQGNKPFWRAFQSFYMNRVKGEVWDISMAEPMDSHQKGIWNHPKIFRPLMAPQSFSNHTQSKTRSLIVCPSRGKSEDGGNFHVRSRCLQIHS